MQKQKGAGVKCEQEIAGLKVPTPYIKTFLWPH
jgi:hypothetical protein